jgi:hypothetical protein
VAALAALTLLALAAVISLLHAWIAAARRLKPAPGPEIPQPYPDVPVEPGNWSRAAAMAALAWGAVNLLGLGALWLVLAKRESLELEVAIAAVYMAVAAALTTSGGIWLLRRDAFGRKLAAWGGFLMAVLAFLTGVAALATWYTPQVPPLVREIRIPLLIGALVHLVLDTIVGAMAQRAGRPPEKVVD